MKKNINSVKYWQERGGQIEWRIAEVEAELRSMYKDLKECDDKIKELRKIEEAASDENT